MSNKIQHRGPDASKHLDVDFSIDNEGSGKVFMGFHRLAINGLDESSGQPLTDGSGVYLIANAEIFNYKKLIEEGGFENDYKTNSDCEIIIHMYKKYGIDETCRRLDGEFAFMLIDLREMEEVKYYIARDQLGVRSLYWWSNGREFMLSSEVKAMIGSGFENNISQFPIGSYWGFENGINKIVRYFDFADDVEKICGNDKGDGSSEGNVFEYGSETEICAKMRDMFVDAVEKRLLSDRKVACLLSGGLDSSTVAAIVAKKFGAGGLNTYSIGMKGATDLKYAESMAKHINSNHVNIEVSEDAFLNAIEKTIYQIESYDTTTVRASVGNYLVSLFIRENSDDTVIFCGDVSDEIFASYRGFSGDHNEVDFYNENIKMLNNIHYFDILRSDKSISGAGLEARVPFADKAFVEFVMKLRPELKKFSRDGRMEKYLFRMAFIDYLPDDILWRRKEAFSDGVSSTERSWFQIIKEFVDAKYTDEEFEEKRMKYEWNKPYDKESLYYREIFEKYYSGMSHLIPYFWRHPFSTQLDPSARLLASY
jgi:asparagine synthase (glutamine-hydrolysing)